MEWYTEQQKEGFDKKRFIRRYHRDPQVIQASIARGLLSKDDKEIINSYKESIDSLVQTLSSFK
jgi:hypothetical protein